jgi:hypothetical protein
MVKYPTSHFVAIILCNVAAIIVVMYSIFAGGFLLVPKTLPTEVLNSTQNMSNLELYRQLLKLQAMSEYWYRLAHILIYCWIVFCLLNLILAVYGFFGYRIKKSNEATNAGEMPRQR